MPEVTALKTEYGVVARASRPGPLPFVLKDAETFAVFDAMGDIMPEEGGDLGIFHEGMRHCSRLELRLWGGRPILLSSTVREDNCLLTAHLSNPDVRIRDASRVARDVLYVQRTSVLSSESCAQRLHFVNYADHSIEVPLLVRFEADFADIFEVRGIERSRRGSIRAGGDDHHVALRYEGLDGRSRVSILSLHHDTAHRTSEGIEALITLPARQSATIAFSISFREHATDDPSMAFQRAEQEAIERFRQARSDAARISTSNQQFNDWLDRSFADIHLLATPTAHGLYPYAGVPWFSAPFGRDGIITARQCLAIEPNLARGVLGYLAETQATGEDAERDAEPGKILHEARLGEMAELREIPFGRYYGSVDATPLFVMLAGDYFRRTGDLDFIRTVWPNIEAAMRWIDHYGDRNGDGFIDYGRRSSDGLVNQAWKDSDDSIFHADGSDAAGPIAACEVQGYVYGARNAAALLARHLNDDERASRWQAQAAGLRSRFRKRFWIEELGTYALAIDGDGRCCAVRASNAGHVLWTGLADMRHVDRIARGLLAAGSFSGWGVRTLDEESIRYNPMSYHNGSVWPHDNAMIALGLSRYGRKEEVLRIMTGLFDASLFMPMHRLPELFCGFDRREGEGPTLYPVACMPQAWASGAVFALLEACVGMSIGFDEETRRPTVWLREPVLPLYLQEVEISNLAIGGETIDIALHRYESDVGVSTNRRSRSINMVITK